MATFPGGIWAPSTKVDNVDTILAAHMNDAQAEIVAIETAIFTGPLKIGTTVGTGATAGDTVLPNAKYHRLVNAGGTNADLAFGKTAQDLTHITNTVISVNNNAAISLGPAARFGYVFVVSNEDVAVAQYGLLNATTSEINDPAGIFTPTAGTASSTNIYWSVGNARFELENKRGATRTYWIILIGA